MFVLHGLRVIEGNLADSVFLHFCHGTTALRIARPTKFPALLFACLALLISSAFAADRPNIVITLCVDNWNAPTYSAEGGPKRDGKIRGKVDVTPVERPDHWLNWLQCMRDGKTPHADIDAGYQHAVAVLMAVISYDTGRKTIYDKASRTIKTA